jgi:hypothetical protein
MYYFGENQTEEQVAASARYTTSLERYVDTIEALDLDRDDERRLREDVEALIDATVSCARLEY